jgi:hypothetical protein
MAETFSVQSRLTLSTNVESVLARLIDQFEEFDKVVKDSQEVLAGFAKETGEVGAAGAGSLKEAFAGLKIPQSVLADLTQVCEFGKGFAASSIEAAAAWKEIAAASRTVRSQGAAPAAAGGAGNRRSASGAGAAEDGGVTPFGTGDDYPNAVWQNRDFDARAAAEERAARQRFNDDYMAASRENLDRDTRASAEERAARQKFNDDYLLAHRENRDIDIRNKPEPEAFSHRDLLHGGIGLQIAGDAVTDKAEQAIMSAFDFEHLFAIVTADTRVTPQQQTELRDKLDTTTRNVPGSTRSEALEVFTDLKNVFGDFDEAKGELEPMLQLVTTLRMADLKQGGTGDMRQALSMARFVEDQGGAINPATGTYDPAKFDEIARKAVSIYVATQGRVAPSDMLAFQKQGRTGGMLMDDHALYGETPFFAQGFGASKLGTAIFSDVQVMLANRMTEKTADAFGDLGMYGSKHMVKHGQKSRLEWDQSTLKDADLLRHDPYAWIHDVLGKAIADKLHVDDTTKEGQEAVAMKMTELAQRNTIAGLWADVYRNYGPAQKESRNIAAQNPDMQQHFLQEDPMAQILVFRAAENELMVTTGELLKGPALELLQQLTSALHTLADEMKNNPKLAQEITETVAAAGLLMKALGGLAMAAFFTGPVFKIVGAISTLSGGLSKLVTGLLPFEMGGAGAAGLAGLEGGVAGLTAGGVLGTAAAGLTALVAPIAALAGLASLVKSGSDHETPETRRAIEDLRRSRGSGLGPTTMQTFDGFGPDGRPTAQSLIAPGASTLGTDAHPLVVHVQNQVTGQDIAQGTTSFQASRLNRPPSGFTGSDIRIDPMGAFYGMVTSPN